MSRVTSFLQSGTGMVTAAATLLAAIIWTQDPDVLAFAFRDDGTLDALYESWDNSIAQ